MIYHKGCERKVRLAGTLMPHGNVKNLRSYVKKFQN